MATDQFLQYLSGLLGSGFVVAIFEWVRHIRAEHRTRHLEFISSQVNSLYGPLYFYAMQNEKLAELQITLKNAYDVEYCKPKWSQDPGTQESISSETKMAIDIGNRYTSLQRENNEKMVALIRENSDLLDYRDIEAFHEFVVAWVRDQVEVVGDKLETPLRVYNHLGPIVYYRTEFVDRVRSRFTEKSQELEGWRRMRWFSWSRRKKIPVADKLLPMPPT